MAEEPVSSQGTFAYRIPQEVLDLFADDFRVVSGVHLHGLIWIDPDVLMQPEASKALAEQFDFIAVPKGTIHT
jgi:hypothetical protein